MTCRPGRRDRQADEEQDQQNLPDVPRGQKRDADGDEEQDSRIESEQSEPDDGQEQQGEPPRHHGRCRVHRYETRWTSGVAPNALAIVSHAGRERVERTRDDAVHAADLVNRPDEFVDACSRVAPERLH
jgi:hypothetical protein